MHADRDSPSLRASAAELRRLTLRGRLGAAAIAVAALLGATSLRAQQVPLRLELSVGATHRTPCLMWCPAGGEPGFGRSIDLAVSSLVSPRAGWYASLATYDVRLVPGSSDSYDAIGVSAGLALESASSGSVSKWLRLGVLLHQRDRRRRTPDGGTGAERSSMHPGVEIGAGLAVRDTRTVRVRPGIHYRRYRVGLIGPAGETSFFVGSVGVSVGGGGGG